MGLELFTVEDYAQARGIALVNLQDAIQIHRVTLVEGKLHGEIADAQWKRLGTELVSQAEYARRRAVDPTSVRDAVKAGRVQLIDGKLHPDIADVQWQRNTRARATTRATPRQAELAEGEATHAANDTPAAAAGPSAAAGKPAKAPGLGTDYQDARTRREMAEAEQAELKTAQMAGKLIDKERTLAGVESVFRELRDAMMVAPRTVAPTVVGLKDAREIEMKFAAELRRTFDSFEARVMASAGGGTA